MRCYFGRIKKTVCLWRSFNTGNLKISNGVQNDIMPDCALPAKSLKLPCNSGKKLISLCRVFNLKILQNVKIYTKLLFFPYIID